ncbi:MAG: hypothetical protein IKE17_01760 [Clostridia bacterium]|nr:hypothetical protein [Clostridia bacterium]
MLTCYNPKNEQHFLRMGRLEPSEQVCALWWSGSGFRTRIDCTRLELEAEVAEGEHAPWLAVAVDGAPVARLPLMAGRHRYALLEGMEKGHPHEVTVSRDTQPCDSDTAPLLLRAVYTDGMPFAPMPRPALIEFIGDSLTVGEGCVGPAGAMEWRMAWISNQLAYPTLVSERLNAEKRVIALGGWGVCRSWDANPDCAIGRIYDRLCAVVPSGDIPFDFAAHRSPDAVVINLGTNDTSAMNSLEPADRASMKAEITRSALALISQVRVHAPHAVILWAYGMCGDPLKECLRAAVEQAQAEGNGRVAWLALESYGAEMGSRSHPGRKAHERAAEQIGDELLRLIN